MTDLLCFLFCELSERLLLFFQHRYRGSFTLVVPKEKKVKVYINITDVFFLVLYLFRKWSFVFVLFYFKLGLQQESHNIKPFLRINLEVDFYFLL